MKTRALFLQPLPLVLVLGLCLVGQVSAQMSLELSQLQLHYRVLKNGAKLTEAQSAELRPIEDAVQVARAKGQVGALFRQLNHGVAILEGKPWLAQEDYMRSLLLVTDTSVLDPAHLLELRLTQRYPAEPGDLKLSARATLEPFAGANAAPRAGKAKGREAASRPLAEFASVPADLVFTPLRFSADLADLPDGAYRITVEVRNGDSVLQKVTTPVYALHGFDAKRADFEQRLAKVKGFEPVKASVRYPFDFARVLNQGLVALAPFDFAGTMTKSGELLAAIEVGKDPLAGEKGALSRHYVLEDAGEIMPYRVYVPKSYDGAKAVPLIIALHGLGGTEMTFMQQGGGALPKLAEEKGFIVATPLGYRRNGGYGRMGPPGTTVDAATARMAQLSEQDVMNVLRLVREQYKIDASRIYLMGHSMGGNGTWNLGSKYADIWAAIAPIAGGSVSPSVIPLAKLKENHVPVMCVHGDADHTAPVDASRVMAAEMKKLAMEHEYIEVKGGGHSDVVGPNIPRIVEFFSKYQRGGTQ